MEISRINFCPMIGIQCKSRDLYVQKNTFFLAEPFKPRREKKNREFAVTNALKEVLREKFSATTLKVAASEPQITAIFCEICHLIRSSAYGIADISGLNPNVLLELGMMLALGKPVFIIARKKEEEDIRRVIPSDIFWKRVIFYDDFTEIHQELPRHIQNRPEIEMELQERVQNTEIPLAEKAKRILDEIDPCFAEQLRVKFEELKSRQEHALARLRALLKEARLDQATSIEKTMEITHGIKEQIKEILRKVESVEEFVGNIEDSEMSFLLGNWHYNEKEYYSALERYDWTLVQKSDLTRAWHNKGVVLLNLEKYREAIACFDEVTEREPCNEGAWFHKGICFSHLGKWEDAKRCYTKVLQLNPACISASQRLLETLSVLDELFRPGTL